MPADLWCGTLRFWQEQIHSWICSFIHGTDDYWSSKILYSLSKTCSMSQVLCSTLVRAVWGSDAIIPLYRWWNGGWGFAQRHQPARARARTGARPVNLQVPWCQPYSPAMGTLLWLLKPISVDYSLKGSTRVIFFFKTVVGKSSCLSSGSASNERLLPCEWSWTCTLIALCNALKKNPLKIFFLLMIWFHH